MMHHAERITFLIYCDEQPNRNVDICIQQLVGHLWYARMHKARIVIPDNYTSLLVARYADQHGIPVQAFGITKAPRNGVNPYMRVAGNTEERDQLLIAEAHTCFFIGNKAKRAAKQALKFEKWVYFYN